MFDVNDNPYRTPETEEGKGEYDWTLAKRVFVAVSMLAFVYLLAGAIGSWQSFRRINSIQRATPIEQIKTFFGDWQSQQRT